MVFRLFPLFVTLCFLSVASAQNSSFTYQGHLFDNGNAASGDYDFLFRLFDMSVNGTEQAGAIARNSVAVKEGVFAVQLDFGSAAFSGAERWLEIAVIKTGTPGSPLPLAPRQPLTASPYATRAAIASSYSGLISDGQLSSNVALLGANQTFTGNTHLLAGTGNFSGTFVGNGAGLTNLSTSGGAGVGAFTGRVRQLPTSPNTLFAAANGFSDAGSTESEVTSLSPGRDLVARNLSVQLNAAPGVGKALIFTLRVNGVDSALTCAISNALTTAHSAGGFAYIPAASVLSLRVSAVGAPNSSYALFGWSFD